MIKQEFDSVARKVVISNLFSDCRVLKPNETWSAQIRAKDRCSRSFYPEAEGLCDNCSQNHAVLYRYLLKDDIDFWSSRYKVGD